MKAILIILLALFGTLLAWGAFAQPLKEKPKDHHLDNKNTMVGFASQSEVVHGSHSGPFGEAALKPGDVIERGDSIIVVPSTEITDQIKAINQQLKNLDDPKWIAEQKEILALQYQATLNGYFAGAVKSEKRKDRVLLRYPTAFVYKKPKK